MKRLLSLLGVTAFALSLTAGEASADVVYNFSGVTFSDGGTLSGSFTTNDAMTSLVGFDITTSSNGGFGFHYVEPGITSFSSLPGILVLETPTLSNLIEITFASLTSTGSLITIGQFDSFEQDAAGDHREITAGSAVVTAVPEPSPLSLAVFGLLGLLGYARRRS